MARSNITRLPNARRKVREASTRPTEKSGTVIRFPIDRVIEPSPYTQRCMERARLMLETGDAAIMQMAMAIFAVMDPRQQARVHGRLVALKALDRSGAANALAWVEYESASKARKQDLDRAASLVFQNEYQ